MNNIKKNLTIVLSISIILIALFFYYKTSSLSDDYFYKNMTKLTGHALDKEHLIEVVSTDKEKIYFYKSPDQNRIQMFYYTDHEIEYSTTMDYKKEKNKTFEWGCRNSDNGNFIWGVTSSNKDIKVNGKVYATKFAEIEEGLFAFLITSKAPFKLPIEFN